MKTLKKSILAIFLLANILYADEPFLGEIRMFAGDFAPRGYAFCDGQLLAINGNQALFSLLGTRYGGNGVTTFGLPDLRGRVPVHAGRGSGLSDKRLGQKWGQENVTLTVSQIPQHTHIVALTATKATATTSSPENARLAVTRQNLSGAQNYSTDDNATEHVQMKSETTNSAGGSQPHNIEQPYNTIHFIIALQGLFPSEN